MRIVQVVESTSAGVGRHVVDLVRGEHSRGQDCTVLYSTLRLDDAFREAVLEWGKSAIAIDMPHEIGVQDVAVSRSIRRWLRRNGSFDIVHGHSSKGGAYARLAAYGSTGRVIYTPHAFAAMDVSQRASKRWVYKTVEKRLAAITDRIICVSPEERAFAVTNGIGTDKCVVVPNGIAEIEYRSRSEVRQSLNLPADEFVIGYVGRLSHQKAPDRVLRSYAELKKTIGNSTLLMVGDGVLREQLSSLATSLDIQGHVRWLGAIEARPLMPAFDVFVLPSRYEGFPYVALEAMAAGLPIVTTPNANCSLLVENAVNGIVVAAGENDRALADAILSLYKSPSRRLAFGKYSKERVKNFTLQKMVEDTLNVYQEVQ